MRHAIVTRIAIALTALLTLASVLFAWRASSARRGADAREEGGRSADPTWGATLFARHCGECHEVSELAAAFATDADRGLAALRMLAFLDAHAASSALEDRAIVALLLAQSAAAK